MIFIQITNNYIYSMYNVYDIKEKFVKKKYFDYEEEAGEKSFKKYVLKRDFLPRNQND